MLSMAISFIQKQPPLFLKISVLFPGKIQCDHRRTVTNFPGCPVYVFTEQIPIFQEKFFWLPDRYRFCRSTYFYFFQNRYRFCKKPFSMINEQIFKKYKCNTSICLKFSLKQWKFIIGKMINNSKRLFEFFCLFKK